MYILAYIFIFFSDSHSTVFHSNQVQDSISSNKPAQPRQQLAEQGQKRVCDMSRSHQQDMEANGAS